MARSVPSQMTPALTCAPWKPVSVKNELPNRLRLIVRPSCTNEVNSNAWKPRKVAPRMQVHHSQSLDDASMRSPRLGLLGSGFSLFSTAASASTIARDDISSTNVEIDVIGMLRIGFSTCPVEGSFHTSCGRGPTRL